MRQSSVSATRICRSPPSEFAPERITLQQVVANAPRGIVFSFAGEFTKKNLRCVGLVCSYFSLRVAEVSLGHASRCFPLWGGCCRLVKGVFWGLGVFGG